ncbi:MAG: VCBS repeat-containing protein [Planctomycetes bacterium]|nr:VCBS repeat-containing protein [Planctomycetota bacterium]
MFYQSAAAVFLTTPSTLNAGEIHDVDGDGLLDLVGATEIHYQGPARTFVVGNTLSAGRWLGFTDMDHDGDLDLVDDAAVYEQLAPRVFGRVPHTLGGTLSPQSLILGGDLDQDGDLDLVNSLIPGPRGGYSHLFFWYTGR